MHRRGRALRWEPRRAAYVPLPMSDAPPPLAPPSSGSGRPSGGMPPWMPLVVVAVAWAAQGGVLANGFVWDDAIVVRDDPTIARGFDAIPDLLVSPWGGAGNDVGLFRPLVSISLAVQAALHGTSNAFAFHLVNLFLHASVATAFLALLLRVFPGRPLVAVVPALLFAVHPVHTGTVSWIVARGDLLAALLLLLAVLVWTRERGTSLASALVVGLLWFAALLSKEAAATFPLVLLVLDAAIRRVAPREALRARFVAYATLLFPLAAWLVLRVSAVGGLSATSANAALFGRNVLERLLIGSGALVRTAAKLFLPAGLSGDGSNDPVLDVRASIPLAYAGALAAVAVTVVLALVAAIRGRAGPVLVALALFVVLSLPVLQIVPIGAVFEDRFAYLPSLALLVLVGLGADAAVRSSRGRAVATASLLAGVACLAALGLASWSVAEDWRDEEAFDRTLLAEDPGHVRAIGRLTRELLVRAGADREAAAALPATNASRDRIAALQAAAGARAEEAVRLLERARSLPSGRRNATVLWSLGDAYLALPTRRCEEALSAYRELLDVKRVRVGAERVPVERVTDRSKVAVEDRRGLGKIFHNVAVAQLGLNEREAAALAHEASAQWDPSIYGYVRAAGVSIWRDLADPRRALPYLERGALLAPPEERVRAEADAADARAASAHVDDTFAKAAAALARPDGVREAQALFEEVIRLHPTHPEAHVGLARVHRFKGNFRDALVELEAATASLDAVRSAAGIDPDPKLRAEIERMRAQYVKDRDEPDK